MSIQGSPDIIHDSSLVLSLDAANPKSYPGTGTTVYDLSGNNNHFTIQGNVSWNTSVGFGNFTGNSGGNGNKIYRNNFPSNLKTSQGGNGLTVLIWATSSGGANAWRKLIGNADGENYIDLYQSVGYPYGWHTDGSGESLSVDGVSVSSDVYAMDNAGWHLWGATNLNGGTLTNPSQALTIGNEPGTSNLYPWSGYISYVLLYSRVLSLNEILQIHYTTKSRFGL